MSIFIISYNIFYILKLWCPLQINLLVSSQPITYVFILILFLLLVVQQIRYKHTYSTGFAYKSQRYCCPTPPSYPFSVSIQDTIFHCHPSAMRTIILH